jgi:crossover junction endodeoxyribonuclease RuvC
LQEGSKIILGIDPGTLVMGYAILDTRSSAFRVPVMDSLKMNPRKDNYERLQLVYEKVCSIIQTFQPDCLAIEAPFFGKNVQSMLKLGRAQGVAIAACMQSGLPVMEYAPRKVKQAITGNGNAAKEQVWKMIQQLIPHMATTSQQLDASDALAVALCHYYEIRNPLPKKFKKSVDWETFIRDNPGKVRSRK